MVNETSETAAVARSPGRGPLSRWTRRLPAPRATRFPYADRIPLGSDRDRSALERSARWILLSAARSRLGIVLLRMLMKEPSVRGEILLSLSDKMAYQASFDEAMRSSRAKTPPAGFEDLTWIFSSNVLNQRLTRLEFDEAAYLWRLIRTLDAPLVAELGRFRGGTTVLLAAAGARVVSVDHHPYHDRWKEELERALQRLGLLDRVEFVHGDTRTHPPGACYRLAFFDASVEGDAMRAEVANWWPGLEPGGHAVFRDGKLKLPHMAEIPAVLAELEQRPDALRIPDDEVPGWMAHFVKKS